MVRYSSESAPSRATTPMTIGRARKTARFQPPAKPEIGTSRSRLEKNHWPTMM
jgi:hypothetical protein